MAKPGKSKKKYTKKDKRATLGAQINVTNNLGLNRRRQRGLDTLLARGQFRPDAATAREVRAANPEQFGNLRAGPSAATLARRRGGTFSNKPKKATTAAAKAVGRGQRAAARNSRPPKPKRRG